VIIGIGTDLVDIRRIAQTIERHGDRFLQRVFTETECALAERRANRVETYAKRFAAKEACAKALGTGFRAGVFFRDLGVVNLASGRPTMALTGGAARRRVANTPPGSTSRLPTNTRSRRRSSSFRPCRPSMADALVEPGELIARRRASVYKVVGFPVFRRSWPPPCGCS
jgi:holo-[acyl-carrier protein] synthase